ncbi:MAG TPA: low molecular weight protein-tyrosine-phosphatase [Jiangellaceae bacterium]
MADLGVTYRICVVCAGNICRSPIAEVVLRHRLDEAGLSDRVAVESAGTGGWHAGDPADPRALEVLRAHGYDGSAHRARQFDRTWFDRFELVLALDRDNLADLHRIAPDEAAHDALQMLRAYDSAALDRGELDVPDPYYGDESDFEHVLDLVDRAATSLVATILSEFETEHGGEPSRR